MSVVHRLKHNFTAGEISPLTSMLVEISRFKNGCLTMKNMMSIAQGAATRREGFEFIGDMETYTGLTSQYLEAIRFIPFIHSEEYTYGILFYKDTRDSNAHCIFVADDGIVVYPDSTTVDCPPTPEHEVAFTGADDYNDAYGYAAYADFRIQHRSTGGVVTLLTSVTDYTYTYVDGVDDLLNVSWNVTPSGQIEIFAQQIRVVDLPVLLQLPLNFDVEGFDYAQSGDELYLTQSDLAPLLLIRYGHYCWELNTVTFADQPTEWGPADPGSGKDIIEQGWPELVTFHQQRLIFACTTLQNHTVWVSKAGDFLTFTDSDSPSIDDGAFSFSINSETQNKIQWLLSKKALNLSTLASEWTITGSLSYTITWENVVADRQTNNGSERIEPLPINFATLFVERHGRSVDEFVYEYQFDSYKINDISILAPHLTDNNYIIRWAYQQTPNSIVWAILDNGDIIALTYQRDQKVVAWHKHTTDGEFKAITVLPSSTNREDEVWVVVDRDNGLFIEKKTTQFKSGDILDSAFLDSFKTYDDVPVNTITGLDHLEGMDVDILADGAVHASKTVVDGAVTLDSLYSKVVVGLPFESEIKPTVAEIDLKDGSAQGRMQRVIDIEIFLHNTVGCILGRTDQDTGDCEEVIPFRNEWDDMGEALPLFNGVKHISFPEGYDRKVEYFIKQTKPLPLTVLGVVDVVEVT